MLWLAYLVLVGVFGVLVGVLGVLVGIFIIGMV